MIKTMDTKQKLFEMMGKLNHDFKQSKIVEGFENSNNPINSEQLTQKDVASKIRNRGYQYHTDTTLKTIGVNAIIDEMKPRDLQYFLDLGFVREPLGDLGSEYDSLNYHYI